MHRKLGPALISFVAVYILARVLSYLTYESIVFTSIISAAVAIYFVYIYFREPRLVLPFIIGEWLLGGNGGLFQFFGLSLRTLLIAMFIFLWLIDFTNQRKFWTSILPQPWLNRILSALGVIIVVSAVRGLFLGNSPVDVMHDLIPFTYLIVLFPLIYFWHEFECDRAFGYIVALVYAYIIGTALTSLFTLFAFSYGGALIHGDYYLWFRNILAGKVTSLSNGFYRVIEPAQMWLVPIVAVLVALVGKNKSKLSTWFLLMMAFIPLAINLSRTYYIAIFFATLALIMFSGEWKKCLAGALKSATLFLVVVFVLAISATGAKSFGVDLLLSRVTGDADGGSAELSVLSRELRLPVIFEKISLHPFAGNGIGSRLDVYDPVTETNVSTTQYDWGYLEMVSELGIIGTILLCAVWFYTAIRSAIQARKENHPSERIFKWGIFAGVIGLCIANIFAPIMYHAMGIIFLIVVLILISEKLSLIRRIGVSFEALAQE